MAADLCTGVKHLCTDISDDSAPVHRCVAPVHRCFTPVHRTCRRIVIPVHRSVKTSVHRFFVATTPDTCSTVNVSVTFPTGAAQKNDNQMEFTK